MTSINLTLKNLYAHNREHEEHLGDVSAIMLIESVSSLKSEANNTTSIFAKISQIFSRSLKKEIQTISKINYAAQRRYLANLDESSGLKNKKIEYFGGKTRVLLEVDTRGFFEKLSDKRKLLEKLCDILCDLLYDLFNLPFYTERTSNSYTHNAWVPLSDRDITKELHQTTT